MAMEYVLAVMRVTQVGSAPVASVPPHATTTHTLYLHISCASPCIIWLRIILVHVVLRCWPATRCEVGVRHTALLPVVVAISAEKMRRCQPHHTCTRPYTRAFLPHRGRRPSETDGEAKLAMDGWERVGGGVPADDQDDTH